MLQTITHLDTPYGDYDFWVNYKWNYEFDDPVILKVIPLFSEEEKDTKTDVYNWLKEKPGDYIWKIKEKICDN